jgi:hypothetical protein
LENYNSTLSGNDSRALYDAVGGTEVNRASDLQVDDVYAFSTPDGRTGIFKVTSVDPGFAEGDGVTIEVKTEM